MRFIQTFFTFFLILSSFSNCQSNKNLAKQETVNVYVGTATNQATEGIYVFSMNQNTGDFQQKHKETNILNPSFLTLSTKHDILYTVCKVDGQKESGIRAYSIDKKSGKLKIINEQSAVGRGACYISTDKESKHVLVANYGSGSVNLFPIQKDGGLGLATDNPQHKGSSIHPERQKSPHAHFIQQGLNDLIYAADLGTDKIMLYQIENEKLKPSNPASLDLTPGNGPRHIDFHPNGQFLYVMNELGGSVTVFEYQKTTNSFKEVQTISSLPSGFKGYNKSADIHVHPSGNFLYASNRGVHDSIAAFKINQNTGQLEMIEIETESIVWPRNFALSPNGKFLLCANLNDDSIGLFSIDELTGALSFTGKKMMVPKPLCVKLGSAY